MQKPLTPAMHGAVDYATVMGAVAAPRLLNMPPKAATLAYGIGTVILGMAAFTDFKPAIKRALPLRAHEMADATLGMALPALPWMMGFSRNKKARNFFIVLTGMLALNTLLTDWDNKNQGQRRRGRNRRS
jgi:hypothetical protein